MNVNKPIVDIFHAVRIGDRLIGVVIDYPDQLMYEGNGIIPGQSNEVTTSRIVMQHSANVFETQRTNYIVQSWVEDTSQTV